MPPANAPGGSVADDPSVAPSAPYRAQLSSPWYTMQRHLLGFAPSCNTSPACKGLTVTSFAMVAHSSLVDASVSSEP